MPKKKWYTRRGHEIRGPFPESEIKRHVLLGRIRLEDDVSIDQFNWQVIASVPILIPDEMKLDLSVPEYKARYDAARAQLDERVRGDRRGEANYLDPNTPNRSLERRGQPDVGASQSTWFELRKILRNQRKNPLFYFAVSSFIIGCIVSLFFLLAPQKSLNGTDCVLPAAPGVNWKNCVFEALILEKRNLRGAKLSDGVFREAILHESTLVDADMSHSNFSKADFSHSKLSNAKFLGSVLRGANFSGADLQGADLSNATMQEADLTAADLRGANLSGAVLSGARIHSIRLEGAILDNAVWIDNSVCAPQSLGQCVAREK